MNFAMIIYVLGWLLIFDGIFMTVPLMTAFVCREDAAAAFLLTMAVCLLPGMLIVSKKPRDKTLYARDGYVIVALSWIVMSLFGALPFVISGVLPSYADALFETVSGFTTTGATVIKDVEALPRSIIMWRSFTHWVGGMGVLVFLMAFIPLSGGQNMHIMKAESTGPSVNKLMPGVKTTALVLYTLYFLLTLVEFVMLLFGGMSVFEAVNTAFSTAGTGGFGFRNDSFASFSPYCQYVVAAFMLMFSISFSSYHFIIKRRFKAAFTLEVKVFLAVVIGVTVMITLNVMDMFPTLEECFRNVLFTVSSVISTTGFVTADFDLWPSFSKVLLVTIMFIGACAGSTGGGMKVSRIIIMVKGIGKELRQMVHPRQIRRITMDGTQVSHEVVRAVNVYMVSFVLVFVISLLLIVLLDETGLVTGFTAVAATINNIGPGLEAVGPTCNFAFFSMPSKLVLIFDMIAGRLELFPMLVLIHPATWKK